jgi:heterodisulfide reductase subunit C
MAVELSFSEEINNLLYASGGNPVTTCIQCGTCAGTCPAVEYMDHTPRQLIGMIGANMKEEVLASNTYWSCSSCYHCTVRCPAGINITDLMYGLQRFAMWRDKQAEDLIGPEFTESFVKMVMRTGRAFEPALAPTYVTKYGTREMLEEVRTASALFFKGRMPMLPKKIKRLENLREMVRRVIPLGGAS